MAGKETWILQEGLVTLSGILFRKEYPTPASPRDIKGEIMDVEKVASVALVVVVSALMYSLLWLITKGVIWVTFTLFHLNWYQDFWAVFVLMLIVGIFPISKTRK